MSNTRQRNHRKPQRKINHLMRGKLVGLFAVVLLALVCLLGLDHIHQCHKRTKIQETGADTGAAEIREQRASGKTW